VVVIAGITKQDAAAVPGGVAGMYITTTTTTDPSDPDVQLMDAVMAKYQPAVKITPITTSEYSTALAFVDALAGATNAVDAQSVHAALDTMKQTKLPVGGGITFQCGTHPVKILPSNCSSEVLAATVSRDGTPGQFTVINSAPFLG
jgi:branched-chain amino acid transport system substrate-binding protein